MNNFRSRHYLVFHCESRDDPVPVTFFLLNNILRYILNLEVLEVSTSTCRVSEF